MIWNIVTDSSCDLPKLSLKVGDNEIRYRTIPFVIRVGEQEFIDDDQLSAAQMLDTMEQDQSASHTACPAPASWLEAFRGEGNVIAITISKELSGSYNSACVAMQLLEDECPGKNVAVINSVSAGAGLVVLIRKICKNILSGMSFAEVAAQAEQDADNKRTIFALCSFENLIRNGRMSRLVGILAKTLGFWGIGIASAEGKIDIKGKVRGAKKALHTIIEDMKERGAPAQYVIISHCQNEEMAELLKTEVQSVWKDVQVEIHATRGLCSYYAERHGLIVSYL